MPTQQMAEESLYDIRIKIIKGYTKSKISKVVKVENGGIEE
jgi:hypothetical protein